MMHTTKKIGFFPVLTIVMGSLVGSGIFMLPISLAPYGVYALYGWVLSCLGALCLAFVFSWLCTRFPKTGGPHAFVGEAFGPLASYFTGWTYWVVSWVSTAVVFATCIGYLNPLLPYQSPALNLTLQLVLLSGIIGLNLISPHLASRAETFLIVFKFFPLVIVPFMLIKAFSFEHLSSLPPLSATQSIGTLGKVMLLTLWGFVGVETATTPAGIVEDPSKTIPRAIITGTILTAILYLFNSVSILGAVPGNILASSSAPYVVATQSVCGGSWHIPLALISFLISLSSLNAWTLTSGQIAYGLARDNLLPPFFKTQTKRGAPLWGLLLSALGTVPLLVLMNSREISEQITMLIDCSVIAFVFVYLACCIAFIVLAKRHGATKGAWFAGILATLLCSWIIAATSTFTLGIGSLFIISGIPLAARIFKKN